MQTQLGLLLGCSNFRMSRNGIDVLKIQTCFLKVHMHCQGCQQKVKKLLRKIEGVYSVNIDAEHQVVMVSGRVDPDTLIRRLVRSGKHAELSSPGSSRKLYQGQAFFSRNDKERNIALDRFSGQHMFSSSIGSDVKDYRNLENYLNQNSEMKPMGGDIDQNLTAASKIDNSYMRDYGDTFAMDDYKKSMMVPAAYQDFSARRPAYEYDYPPSITQNKIQQHYHYNHPSSQMMDNNNNMMANHNYMNQPLPMNYRSSLVPQYNDFGFNSAQYPFY